jgi:hypothetical protein
LITTGESREQAWLKRQQAIENIKSYLGRPTRFQSQPEEMVKTG